MSDPAATSGITRGSSQCSMMYLRALCLRTAPLSDKLAHTLSLMRSPKACEHRHSSASASIFSCDASEWQPSAIGPLPAGRGSMSHCCHAWPASLADSTAAASALARSCSRLGCAVKES